jgi:signal transduction histidine kinase
MPEDRTPLTWVSVGIPLALRFVTIGLGVLLSYLSGVLSLTMPTALVLAGLAVSAAVIDFLGKGRLWSIAELGLAGIVIGLGAPNTEVFLPYILVGATVIASLHGWRIGLVSWAVSAFALIGIGVIAHLNGNAGDWLAVVTWLVMSLAGVAAGVVARSAIQSRDEDKYQSAYELLSQLQHVRSELSFDLDENRMSRKVLQEIREVTDYHRGCLLRVSSDGLMAPMAVYGTDSAAWFPLDGLVSSDVLASQSDESLINSHISQSNFSESPHQHYRTYLPISLSGNPVAVVYLESPTALTDEQCTAATSIATRSAAMLGAAGLFSEIYRSATEDERQRLAREIHDGIAQELAGLAYLVEDIERGVKDPTLRDDVENLRDRLMQIVTELRLSIFELRSSVSDEDGLGQAIASYVREIGARAGLTVHLVLQESDLRLPAHVESEIMRITQGAVNNVVRHANANNLWVHLRTAPPHLALRVADDGVGLGQGRPDSYGLLIMGERAARIGGTIEARERLGGGTIIEVVVSGSDTSSPLTRDATMQ